MIELKKTNGSVAECLGITKERALQIAFVIGEATLSSHSSDEGTAGVIKRIYENLKMDNERAFAVHHFTKSMERAINLQDKQDKPVDLSKYPQADKMKVLVMDESKKSVDAFIISKERSDELTNIISEIVKINEEIISVLVDVSKYCVHPNELAFCCFIIGAYAEHENEEQKKREILRQFLGGKHE